MKYPAKTDIAVLLLFFTRSDTFAQVFEAVRQARPSKLFLYQDGAMPISIGSARYIVSIWIIIRAVIRRASVPTSGHFH